MSEASPELPPQCHHCASPRLSLAAGYDGAWRVTSDCKPWPPGGVLALCLECGLVQTVASAKWGQECEEIYRGYTIYHQSGGAEQPVFDSGSGASQSRSEAIIKGLLRQQVLPAAGRWLDIGCGNGALLRACSQALPGGWALCGSEVSDKNRQAVEAIPGLEGLYTCPLAQIPGRFDVISLIHVVEHIPGPRGFLEGLASQVKPGGLLLLEVPDCRQNSFALMIADHCSHFSSGMVGQIAAAAGYELLEVSENWVPKEITVLARHTQGRAPLRSTPPPLAESEQVFGGWTSLQRLLAQIAPLTQEALFGIFGTSIAATWLDAQIGGRARFFVDEDPQRAGGQHLGRRIFAPADVPAGATVILALAPAIAERVGDRWRARRPDVRFVNPA